MEMMSREEFDRFVREHGPFTPDDTPSFLQFETFMSQRTRRSPQRPSSSNAETQASAHTTTATVDDLLDAPGRHLLTQLHPKLEGGATWFKRDSTGKITKSILRMMKTDLKKAYPTYRKLPIEHKDRWFRAFAREFHWDKSITVIVREAFDKQASASYTNNLSDWKDIWKLKKDKPEWIGDTAWEGFINIWTTNKVASTAETNSQNRKSERDGDGQFVHHMGSKSYYRRWDEMTVENGGEEPGMVEFMEEVHTCKKTGLIPDKKAKRILKAIKEKVEMTQSQRRSVTEDGSVQSNTLSQTEINAIVMQEIPKVKGRHFGFGTLLSSRSTSSSKSCDLEHEEKLQLANEKIATMAETIQYLSGFAKKVLVKFPELLEEDDADATQDDTQE
ncbi:uncharacterized protein LOC112083970 [Eutrema salsugineum]|uniref:uncharacterized protein LOC112083970 n=1 Tax=Eutrema salsugineum TaxID=72664 RepID=UPI000CED29A1|nr:uncharacterized protein LOC112083970 [Eutrema salsugineum]